MQQFPSLLLSPFPDETCPGPSAFQLPMHLSHALWLLRDQRSLTSSSGSDNLELKLEKTSRGSSCMGLVQQRLPNTRAPYKEDNSWKRSDQRELAVLKPRVTGRGAAIGLVSCCVQDRLEQSTGVTCLIHHRKQRLNTKWGKEGAHAMLEKTQPLICLVKHKVLWDLAVLTPLFCILTLPLNASYSPSVPVFTAQ